MVGVPDDTFGQKVVAIITLKSAESVTKQQLMEFLKTRLAPYKLPRGVTVVATIPRNQLGKVNKKTIVKDLNIKL